MTVLGAAAAAASWTAAPAASAGEQLPLEPNVTTATPSGFHLDASPRRVLLRFTNATPNIGAGALELRPRRDDCDGDGLLRNDRTAIQNVYLDSDGDGEFARGTDTEFTKHVAGCFRFHAAHDHWHFTRFARYELRQLEGTDTVATHQKVGFCVVDSRRPFPALPGSPSSAYYTLGDCDPGETQGLSVGWEDVYFSTLPGQWVDVSAVPDGDYCLVSTVDPADRLLESDDSDNAAMRGVRLQDGSVQDIGPC